MHDERVAGPASAHSRKMRPVVARTWGWRTNCRAMSWGFRRRERKVPSLGRGVSSSREWCTTCSKFVPSWENSIRVARIKGTNKLLVSCNDKEAQVVVQGSSRSSDSSNEWQSNSTLQKAVENLGVLYRNSAINGYIEVDSASESGGKPL